MKKRSKQPLCSELASILAMSLLKTTTFTAMASILPRAWSRSPSLVGFASLSVQRSGHPMPDEKAFQAAIVLRIGINLGDVIIENDDIYGDGVNIAARLEPLAEPGCICVSSIVNESVGNRIDARFLDGGDVSVKKFHSRI